MRDQEGSQPILLTSPKKSSRRRQGPEGKLFLDGLTRSRGSFRDGESVIASYTPLHPGDWGIWSQGHPDPYSCGGRTHR